MEPPGAAEIRARLGFQRRYDEDGAKLRLLVGQLGYDWTSYCERILDAQLAALAHVSYTHLTLPTKRIV